MGEAAEYEERLEAGWYDDPPDSWFDEDDEGVVMQLELDPGEMAVLCGALTTAKTVLSDTTSMEAQGMPPDMRADVNEAVTEISRLLDKCEAVVQAEVDGR